MQTKGITCLTHSQFSLRTFLCSRTPAPQSLRLLERLSSAWLSAWRCLWPRKSIAPSKARLLGLNPQFGISGRRVIVVARRSFLSSISHHEVNSLLSPSVASVGLQMGLSPRPVGALCLSMVALFTLGLSQVVAQTPTPPPPAEVVTISPHDPAFYSYDSDSDTWTPYAKLIEDACGQQSIVLCILLGTTLFAIASRNIRF